MVVEIDRRPRQLVVADRCDRCSSRALVETVMLGGGALLWCGHHYSAYEDSLSALGAKIVADIR